ncbi:hypothetical protein [Streptomyces sp. 1222.5]|uniref:hypothetical protein n=1 Tax=Streptomyces sp. 1222.5 TaxID=1881026 RepID=UPI003EB97B73
MIFERQRRSQNFVAGEIPVDASQLSRYFSGKLLAGRQHVDGLVRVVRGLGGEVTAAEVARLHDLRRVAQAASSYQQDRVSVLQEQMDEARDQLGAFRGRVSGLERTNGRLEEQLDVLAQRLEQEEQRADEAEGRAFRAEGEVRRLAGELSGAERQLGAAARYARESEALVERQREQLKQLRQEVAVLRRQVRRLSEEAAPAASGHVAGAAMQVSAVDDSSAVPRVRRSFPREGEGAFRTAEEAESERFEGLVRAEEEAWEEELRRAEVEAWAEKSVQEARLRREAGARRRESRLADLQHVEGLAPFSEAQGLDVSSPPAPTPEELLADLGRGVRQSRPVTWSPQEPTRLMSHTENADTPSRSSGRGRGSASETVRVNLLPSLDQLADPVHSRVRVSERRWFVEGLRDIGICFSGVQVVSFLAFFTIAVLQTADHDSTAVFLCALAAVSLLFVVNMFCFSRSSREGKLTTVIVMQCALFSALMGWPWFTIPRIVVAAHFTAGLLAR